MFYFLFSFSLNFKNYENTTFSDWTNFYLFTVGHWAGVRDNMDVQMFGCCSFGKTVKSMMEKHYNLKPVSDKKGHQEYVQFLKRLLSQ